MEDAPHLTPPVAETVLASTCARGRRRWRLVRWTAASLLAVGLVAASIVFHSTVAMALRGCGQGVDGGHVLAGELEVEDVDVLAGPLGADRLGDHRQAVLQVPAENHLRGGLAVSLGHAGDRRVLKRAVRGFGLSDEDGHPTLLLE